ncbi:MAG: TIGR01458 family HAD-type hydrolase [Gammaproteobacteria bacterium]|nr:TIGR01458 family HAD-type hydrolase [Gammaproteobacteria bacterium]MDH3466284.1 TIGR01458 family HAD-type hydrolase [Gammaproteobacteria bacterium]
MNPSTPTAHAALFDLDGVLYQGEHAVPGAPEAVAWLRTRGVPLLFITNTSSRPRQALVDKLEHIGIPAAVTDILSPPAAATAWLQQHVTEPIGLFVTPATIAEFAGLSIADEATRRVGAVVIGDLGDGWDFRRLNDAFRMLMQEPKPPLLALGMTRYWQKAGGLQLDTGPFVAALQYAAGVTARVFGKPAAEFFQAAIHRLAFPAERICMIGDDIYSDIDAAQRIGLRGILVKTGKFRATDLDQGILPNAVLDSIADLPAWWQSHFPIPQIFE